MKVKPQGYLYPEIAHVLFGFFLQQQEAVRTCFSFLFSKQEKQVWASHRPSKQFAVDLAHNIISPSSQFAHQSIQDRQVKTNTSRQWCHLWACPSTNTHHIGAIDGCGHLDLPEVLPVSHCLRAPDCGCTTAVVDMEAHFTLVICQVTGRRL